MKPSSGGKAWNMHVDVRERRITGTGGKDKTAIIGMLERGGLNVGSGSSLDSLPLFSIEFRFNLGVRNRKNCL